MENNIKSTRFAGIVVHVGMLSEDPEKPVNIMTNILFGAKTGKDSFLLLMNLEANGCKCVAFSALGADKLLKSCLHSWRSTRSFILRLPQHSTFMKRIRH